MLLTFLSQISTETYLINPIIRGRFGKKNTFILIPKFSAFSLVSVLPLIYSEKIKKKKGKEEQERMSWKRKEEKELNRVSIIVLNYLPPEII